LDGVGVGVCELGVIVGVIDGVKDTVGVFDGVKDTVGVFDGVKDIVGVCDIEVDGVFVCVCVGVDVGVGEGKTGSVPKYPPSLLVPPPPNQPFTETSLILYYQEAMT